MTGEKKESGLSKKEMVYLVLPLLFLIILFPTVLQQDHVLISEYHDTLLAINSDFSVIDNPLALWNNRWLTGLPQYADPLSNLYYPFFFPALMITQDIFSVNGVILVHLYLAFLFFYLLSGLITKNPEIRLVSALFYIFSGVLLARLPAGHISLLFALTWIPVLYFGFFKILWDEERTVQNIGIIAVSLALIFFTGAVYYLFYAFLVLAVFFVYSVLKKTLGAGSIIALFSGFTIGGMLLAVKLIPLMLVSGALGRIDVIDPLGDGGSLENNLASIIFGTPIDSVFGFYESAVLIGIIPVLLVILALVFGREDRAIPAFFAVLIAFVWADGGRTLLSFVHLLPGLANFRVAGRVLGAVVPILILFAISGFQILYARVKTEEPLIPDPLQKKHILVAAGLLVLIKVIELPYQSMISLEAGLSVAFIALYAGMLFVGKGTVRNLLVFFVAAFLIDAAIIFRNVPGSLTDTAVRAIIIIALVIGAVALFNRDRILASSGKNQYLCLLLIAGLGIALVGNTGYLKSSDPNLDQSEALAVIEKIKTFDVGQAQIWVYETGWPIQHMDFTHWFIKNKIHPTRAYYPYFLDPMISAVYTIGNTSYYTPDFIVDTAYLENGNQNIDQVTFKVNNISVFKPDNVLPNAFVIRENVLVPSVIETFSPDEVTISGKFAAGDIAFLKSSFYPGWKLDGREASSMENMIGAEIPADTTAVTFRFDPLDMKIAMIISGAGILLLIALAIRRRDIEKYLSESGRGTLPLKDKKRKKR